MSLSENKQKDEDAEIAEALRLSEIEKLKDSELNKTLEKSPKKDKKEKKKKKKKDVINNDEEDLVKLDY